MMMKVELKVIKIQDRPVIVKGDFACLWSINLLGGYTDAKRFLRQWFKASRAQRSELTERHYLTLIHHKGVRRWNVRDLGAYWVSARQLQTYLDVSGSRLKDRTRALIEGLVDALTQRKQARAEQASARAEASRPVETWQDRYRRALDDLRVHVAPALLSTQALKGAVRTHVVNGLDARDTEQGQALRALDACAFCDLLVQLESGYLISISCKSTRRATSDALLLSARANPAQDPKEFDLLVSAPEGVLLPEYYLTAHLDDAGLKSLTLVKRSIVQRALKDNFLALIQKGLDLHRLPVGQGVRLGPLRYHRHTQSRVIVSLQFDALRPFAMSDDKNFIEWVRTGAPRKGAGLRRVARLIA